MLWVIEHGEHEEVVREQMRINQMPAPRWIVEKPELKLGLEFYWKAFWELATCRHVAQGAEGPIPWLAMQAYANQFEIRGEEFDRFILILKHMDTEYLKTRGKKLGKINPSQGGKPQQKPPRPKERKPIGSK